MKLYYAPGTCSLSPHIVLRESGLPFELVRADIKSHTLTDGSDFYGINPKGYVPVLELDSGERLTEGPAIVQYLADQVPDKQLAPAAGTMARYRLMEWLNYITTELHKGYSPLFNPAMPDAAKTIALDKLKLRYQHLDRHLANAPFVLGAGFTVADAYLFTVTQWARAVGLDLTGFANLQAFMTRMRERPAVKEALQAEKPSA